LDYGADINALTCIGSTALHTSFYFGTVATAKALLYHDYKDSKMVQKINVSKRFTARLTNGTVIEYEPLQSPTKRDC